MSQKEIVPSSYTYYTSDGTCHRTDDIPDDVTLFNLNVQNKKFIVLEFKNMKFGGQVLIKDAFLSYSPKELGDEDVNQVVYIAPIRFENDCTSLDAITEPDIATQPWPVTTWNMTSLSEHAQALSPNISDYVKVFYGKNYPNPFAIRFLIYWKEGESEKKEHVVNNLKLVINYRHLPGSKKPGWYTTLE